MYVYNSILPIYWPQRASFYSYKCPGSSTNSIGKNIIYKIGRRSGDVKTDWQRKSKYLAVTRQVKLIGDQVYLTQDFKGTNVT